MEARSKSSDRKVVGPAFGFPVGFLDHVDGGSPMALVLPALAVAFGANLVEKHITLDRATPVRNFLTGGEYLGTDHVLSLEPAELEAMVRTVRAVEVMLGTNEWQRSEGELTLRRFLRDRFHHDMETAE